MEPAGQEEVLLKVYFLWSELEQQDFRTRELDFAVSRNSPDKARLVRLYHRERAQTLCSHVNNSLRLWLNNADGEVPDSVQVHAKP